MGRVEGPSLFLDALGLELCALPKGERGTVTTPNGGSGDTTASREAFEVSAGWNIVTRAHPQWAQILEQAIKPYDWSTHLVVVGKDEGVTTFALYWTTGGRAARPTCWA